METKVLVGMDIGTTKVCTVISKINEMNELEIIGVGLVPSRGLRKGVVINIETTANSIASSVEKGEIQAGIEIKGAYIGISGGHVEGITSKGVIAISDKNKEITDADVRRVVDAAMAIVIPVDREVVHVIPQEFIVDNQGGVKNPVGMSGIRLEAIVNVITAAASSINNMVKSVNRAGYDTLDIILEPLAAAQAVLTEEEKELGVALVDIGGGTTDYIIFENGSTRKTGIISLGGNQITNDVAFVLRTPTNAAEEIKKRYGAAIADYIPPDEEIEIPGLGGRSPTIEKRKNLVEVIEARIEEILSLVNLEFEKNNFKNRLPAGVVLTGGVALTPFIVELAGEIFGLPVRVGKPLGISGLKDIVDSPVYSTAVGLALYAKDHLPRLGPVNTRDDEKNFKSIIDRIRDWFNEFF